MRYLALDVGTKRIGVATADSTVKIARCEPTLENNDNIMETLDKYIREADTVVVGYPRNQQGEPTAQTAFVVGFTEQLQTYYRNVSIIYQDESLTSVMAEGRLAGKAQNGKFDKGDVDAEAACIILEDYMGLNHGQEAA